MEILTLNNVTEKDAGEYICKVSNYIGEANQSGWLTVIPGKPFTHLSMLPAGVVSWASLLPRCAVVILMVVGWWCLGGPVVRRPSLL